MAESDQGWRRVPGKPVSRGGRPRQRGSVAGRLAALEQRVEALENQLRARTPAPARTADPRPGPRCPGCYLQVASVARGRCPWCGFVFDALVELRRAARRRGG